MAETAYVGKPIGLSNLTWFPITSDTPEKTVYGEPIKLSRAIKAQLSPQFASAVLESDDSVEDDINLLTALEVTIDASQIDDTVRAKVFGHKLDEKGGLTFNRTDTPTEGALAFRALLSKKNGVDKYVYIVLYKGTFKELEESFETLKKGGISFQTHNGLKGTFVSRESDGNIYYRMREDTPAADAATIKAWFTKVQPAPAG